MAQIPEQCQARTPKAHGSQKRFAHVHVSSLLHATVSTPEVPNLALVFLDLHPLHPLLMLLFPPIVPPKEILLSAKKAWKQIGTQHFSPIRRVLKLA